MTIQTVLALAPLLHTKNVQLMDAISFLYESEQGIVADREPEDTIKIQE